MMYKQKNTNSTPPFLNPVPRFGGAIAPGRVGSVRVNSERRAYVAASIRAARLK